MNTYLDVDVVAMMYVMMSGPGSFSALSLKMALVGGR